MTHIVQLALGAKRNRLGPLPREGFVDASLFFVVVGLLECPCVGQGPLRCPRCRLSVGTPACCSPRSRVRNIALCDFVTRVLADMLRGGTGTDWTQTVSGGGWGGSKAPPWFFGAVSCPMLEGSGRALRNAGHLARLLICIAWWDVSRVRSILSKAGSTTVVRLAEVRNSLRALRK